MIGAPFRFFEGKTPCYIVIRLEEEKEKGKDWMLLSYVPDGSPVRQRMLYGSTRELLKRQLGSSVFSADMHGSTPDDFSYEAYVVLRTSAVESPLTEAEITTRAEATMEVDYGTTREYVHSVSFPMARVAADALKAIGSSKSLVQLELDLEKETIELRQAKDCAVGSLGSEIPSDQPCFSFYRYDHTHAGTDVSPIVFIYSCPNGAKIKAKMLYSTVKAAATGAAEDCGVKIEKKLEISEGSELDANLLNSEIHPAENQQTKQAFKRPMKPGRGRPRMTARR